MTAPVIESLPDGAGIVHVGDLSFVSPWPEFRATPSQFARLETVAVLASMPGTQETRRALLAEIEREMAREAKRRARLPDGRAVRAGPDLAIEEGPLALVPGSMLGLPVVDTPEGRVYCPDPHRDRYDANKAPAMAKFERLTYVEPEPVQIQPKHLTKDQRDDLKEASTLLRSSSRADRIAGRAKGEGVQRQLLARAEQNAVNRGRTESAALEANRWEVSKREHLEARRRELADYGVSPAGIEAMLRKHATELDAAGSAHLDTRNGLDSLLASGSIDRAEHAAGEKYAQVFEKARSKLRTANLEGAGGGGAVAEDVEQARRLRELKAKQALTELDAYVQAQVKSPRALMVLRLVAGEGRCVAYFSKGASRAKNVEALQLALEALAIRWGLK